ncbi:D-TA family PLP-dependent enzyme [Mucilaginibacter sp. ZB1P21]|uniref:D-TA family PLP-dependent enzyme n=1 Tax=Mucilaginibacter glaciei TaxID=2772109 RepID=A0A926S0S1_9SPHI|nr:D-TA family PLP-dependent enzyme [Mucilaginibacter glaciei]
MTDWYIIDDVEQLDTPALVVYPDRVKYNIELVKTIINDLDRLRPHVKTHKSAEVTRLMLQAGITKFKCATIAEAEMLGMCKALDVLLAYQPTGPKLQRFINLINAYPQTSFSCLVDNAATAKLIAGEAVANNILINIYIDLNIGMNRTGILAEQAFELYKQCADLRGIHLMGLHAYDGHIHDSDYKLRELRSEESMLPLYDLMEKIAQQGLKAPVLISGGSPTYPIMANKPDLECSPGTFVYWDRGYQLAFAEQPFQTAALIIARVISLPDDGRICIDIGHKSVSAENDITKRIYFLNAPELVFIGQSEEHLIADAGINHTYKVGNVLYGLPYHICPTIALYERAITIEDHRIMGEWKNIARDRKLTI